MTNPSVLIFTGRLLPTSETFIKAQAEGLVGFTPYYVGARLINGLPLPAERTMVVNQGSPLGKLREYGFKRLGIAPGFYRRLSQVNPQLVHAHFGVCGALALPLANALKIPLVVTYHGFDASMTDDYARKDSLSTRTYLRRRVALKQNAHQFLAVSEFIKANLIKQGFPPEKVCVHYIGIDTNRFQPQPSVTRQKKILFVGRLVEKKGCEYLIRAMAEVQAVEPEAELVIVGEGPLRPTLETLAKATLKRFVFMGLQTSDQVKQLMNKATLLVTPSVTTADGDAEGLPMVILEAQAMGLPVVSSYHAGIPEAVVPNETGLLTAERDWQAIAKAIVQLLQDPHRWQAFSHNGQQQVSKHFNLSEQNKQLGQIYQSLAKPGSLAR